MCVSATAFAEHMRRQDAEARLRDLEQQKDGIERVLTSQRRIDELDSLNEAAAIRETSPWDEPQTEPTYRAATVRELAAVAQIGVAQGASIELERKLISGMVERLKAIERRLDIPRPSAPLDIVMLAREGDRLDAVAMRANDYLQTTIGDASGREF